jgi:starvation-inducible DNA-binding protein
MNTDQLQTVLEETFAANFVAYYRAHVAHVNTVGRNFISDHKLLQKVYEDLQGNIDPIAELLRTIGAQMPTSINTVLAISPFADDATEGDADELLQLVLDDQDRLMELYKELDAVAVEAGDIDISNFAQGRVGDHAKFRWMLRSTLELD